MSHQNSVSKRPRGRPRRVGPRQFPTVTADQIEKAAKYRADGISARRSHQLIGVSYGTAHDLYTELKAGESVEALKARAGSQASAPLPAASRFYKSDFVPT